MPTLLQLGSIRSDIQAQLHATYYRCTFTINCPRHRNGWRRMAPRSRGVVTGGHNGICDRTLMNALPNLKIVAINGVGYGPGGFGSGAKAKGIRGDQHAGCSDG